MKQLLPFCLSIFLLANTLYSQSLPQFNYNKQWQTVADFEAKSLPESAIKIVDAIYLQANKDGNAEQLIKAVIHQLKYIQTKREDAFVKSLLKLEQETAKASFPAKPILHSMLAELYWQYYSDNRWSFSQRSATENFKQEDIATWDLTKIVNTTQQHYQASLADKAALKNVKLEQLSEIISGSSETGRQYRPTLFDFLAHRAVDFFMGDEPQLTKPAYAFTLADSAYFSPSNLFAALPIASKDSTSMKLHALQLLQELERFQQKDSTPAPLIDVVLKRLIFVKNHSAHVEKEQLFLNALEKLERQYLQNSASTNISYEIAKVYQARGALYKPLESDAHQFDLKKAFDVAEAATKRFPKSYGAAKCGELMTETAAKSLSAIIERVNLSKQASLARIEYKNIKEVYWKIVKTSPEEWKQQMQKWERNYNVNREEKILEFYNAKASLKSGKVNFLDEGDYQRHSTEIKLDALDKGIYVVLLSNRADFVFEKNGMAYVQTTISDLSYKQRTLKNGDVEVIVVDRSSGLPIEGVKAEVFLNVYNAKESSYDLVKQSDFSTDKDGKIKIIYKNQGNRHRDIHIEFSYKGDFISKENVFIYAYPSQERTLQENTTFFLDRNIYRPGQTIYFKGLKYNTDGKTSTIIANTKIDVVFTDVNDQEIARQKFVTNAYGSFQGSFTTPTSGLFGQMSLACEGGNAYFSVEEYKRPKFEVTFEPIKTTFRLGDKIEVKGQAKAYSGANIDGAKVQYRVVRKARYPDWWCYGRGYFPNLPELEIINGNTITDAEGKYTIPFVAQPDLSLDKSASPIFAYTVYADVTDINGETHSNTTTIQVGYIALEVSVAIGDIDQSDSKVLGQKYEIRSKNLAGEYQAAKGKLTVHQLQHPEKAFRKRPWEQVDRMSMSKQEFEKYFPNDEYADENEVTKWEKKKQVLALDFDTDKEKMFALEAIAKWPLGQYVLEINTQDIYGQPVKEVVYFKVIASRGKQLALTEIDYFQPLNTTCEPGEVATILVGTTAANTKVLYEVEQDHQIISQEWLTLSNEQRLLQVPIKESYRGNVAVHYTFVHDNRYYAHTENITVPYTNKELDISFETFRDKLQPGKQEQWKVKIKGKTADKFNAEMVASMYDMSLDAFGRPYQWEANFFGGTSGLLGWSSSNSFAVQNFTFWQKDWEEKFHYQYPSPPNFDVLNWYGFNINRYSTRYERSMFSKTSRNTSAFDVTGNIKEEALMESSKMVAAPATMASSDINVLEKTVAKPATLDSKLSIISARKNFNETAFFFPNLMTNADGEIIINFTMPEALTRWKMQAFAHTQDFKSGYVMKELVTQKELMVVPNAPRFYREGDKMQFSVKISSLVDKVLAGQAQLEFFDALTMKPVNAELQNSIPKKDFTLNANQSTQLEWSINIPKGLQALTYRVVAKAGNFSDGEEMTLPVVTNSMLVTESLPLWVRGKQTKAFTFDKLKNTTSTTLRNHKYTLEFSSNPAWYAIQSLPYLMEYPYECVEQTFSRYYANSIAAHIANSNPRIKQVFDTWRTIQPDALLSNLEKNQELKTALLEETPWVLQAKDESQRKRNLALLFDLNRMANEKESAFEKIKKAQDNSGGFCWFAGMPPDRYMTQHIVAGMGHLEALGIREIRGNNNKEARNMVKSAIQFMDDQIKDDYERLKALEKKKQIKMNEYQPDYIQIHYLYTRSYFNEVALEDKHKAAFSYFLKQAKRYWTKQSIYMQGMLCLATSRFGDKIIPKDMIKSFRERALQSEEMGMYWKYNRGYYWHEAPIETQALMIEVFSEVAQDTASVEEMKIWLLKQKQTQDWKTTKATAEACYALLLRGTDQLASTTPVEITVGKENISKKIAEEAKVEAGTGYFKTSWTAPEIAPQMANISITKKDAGVAWGAAYWQYFEQLDKITTAETPLKLNKKLFLERATDRGPVITPVTAETKLQVGDLLKVRIELRADRNMEYIHLKDMRAAALEPVNTLSTYKYQDGLGYYESTRDMATNFFIGYLPKGTYVFEYPLRVSQKGDFSNGITTVQSMYAPEFSSHSEGVRVEVK